MEENKSPEKVKNLRTGEAGGNFTGEGEPQPSATDILQQMLVQQIQMNNKLEELVEANRSQMGDMNMRLEKIEDLTKRNIDNTYYIQHSYQVIQKIADRQEEATKLHRDSFKELIKMGESITKMNKNDPQTFKQPELPTGYGKPWESIQWPSAWQPDLKLNDVVIERANKVLDNEPLGFGTPEILSFALERSQLVTPERPRITSDSLVKLNASYEKEHMSSQAAWKEISGNATALLSSYCDVFQQQVEAEKIRTRVAWAKAFLKGLVRKTNPRDKGKAIKIEDFKVPDADSIFQKLAEGRKDVGNFMAFLGLHQYYSFQYAKDYAKKHPKEEVEMKPLPNKLIQQQPSGVRRNLEFRNKRARIELPAEEDMEEKEEMDNRSVITLAYDLADRDKDFHR